MEEKRVIEGGETHNCAALTDLAAAFEEARMPDRAAAMRARAAECGRAR